MTRAWLDRRIAAGADCRATAALELRARQLTDGLGPLFNPNSEQTVIQAVWNIEDALGVRQSGR
jgi:hypothetical protein